MAGASTDETNFESLVSTAPVALRWAMGLSGTVVLLAGAVAVFKTSNGSGTAALIAAGVVLIVVAVLAERLESIEAAGMKVGMRAQAAAKVKEHAAVAADENGDHEEAKRLRRQAAELREIAAATGRSYERIRSQMGSGWHRTERLENLLEDAMRSAPQVLDAEIVGDLFKEGSEGSRVVALRLMQRDPAMAYVPGICEAINEPRSALEQWHGLSAAERAVAHGIPPAEEEKLRNVLHMALAEGRIRQEDSDRHSLAERILQLL